MLEEGVEGGCSLLAVNNSKIKITGVCGQMIQLESIHQIFIENPVVKGTALGPVGNSKMTKAGSLPSS